MPEKSITGALFEREYGPAPGAISPERAALLEQYPTLKAEEQKRNERQGRK
jgi:hypothetical protein